MPLQTRGSAELDKAQRRLAGLKSIDPNLDLGYGLTIDSYSEQIETLRAALAKHNQMVADLDASRKTIDELDRAMANTSGRVLSAVKIKYGSNSKEYSQAGGKIRRSTTSAAPSSPVDQAEMLMTIASNGNGRAKVTTAK